MRVVLFATTLVVFAGCSLDWDGIVTEADDGGGRRDSAADAGDSGLPDGGDPCADGDGAGCPGFDQLAIGGFHSCGVRPSGAVICWGNNLDGQLGIATDEFPEVPVDAGITNAAYVVAGGTHSCALRMDGKVSCWGRNWNGQLGIGTMVSRELSPVEIPGLTGVVSLAAGKDHTCAVTGDGNVHCWGHNRLGQVGTNSTRDFEVLEPRHVVGIGDAVEVAAGYSHTCARLTDGRVMCWGRNDDGELGNGGNVDSDAPVYVMGLMNAEELALGGDHSCARRADETVVCWGHNEFGQVGDGTTEDATTFRQVADLEGVVRQIAAGPRHSCALNDAGAVWCWGRNRAGELGDRTTASRGNPMQVLDLPPVDEIRTGGATHGGHACARTAAGALYCWGYRGYGQLGDGATVVRTTPVQVVGATGKTISVGDLHACSGGGPIECWGNHHSGQIGIGSDIAYATPQNPAAPPAVAHVAAGTDHSCAIDTEGALWCWGSNADGELGVGDLVNRSTPQKVGSESDWIAVDAGGDSTCGIRGSSGVGEVWCWGDNALGQLGIGMMVGRRTTPTELDSSDSFAAISVGSDHACATRVDQQIFCWGANARGQLGLGDFDDRLSPTRTPIDSVVAVDAGFDHTCAVLMGGRVWCWGDNSRRKLGDAGFTGERSWDPIMSTVTGATALALGEHFSCAIVGGGVTCWGRGTYGELGRDVATGTASPGEVTGLTGVVSLGAAKKQACAITGSGRDLGDEETWCWGFAPDGRLGDGQPPFLATPVIATDLRP